MFAPITPAHIVLACVFIFLIYWIVSATNVKKTQEVQNNLWDFRIVAIVCVVLIYLAVRFHLDSYIPILPLIIIPNSPIVIVLSIICALSGLIIAVIARRTLGGNWSNNIDLKKHHTLITTGIYGYIRHPIYTGSILLLLSLTLSNRNVITLLLSIIGACFLVYKLKQEEKLLSRHFPKEYGAYRKRTKALIPFVF